jgi:hypothetical protein
LDSFLGIFSFRIKTKSSQISFSQIETESKEKKNRNKNIEFTRIFNHIERQPTLSLNRSDENLTLGIKKLLVGKGPFYQKKRKVEAGGNKALKAGYLMNSITLKVDNGVVKVKSIQ